MTWMAFPLLGGTGIGKTWHGQWIAARHAVLVGCGGDRAPCALGPFSSQNTFLVGPQCGSSAELGVPDLISPINGEEVNANFAWLHYQATSFGCIPDGWALDLQTDPNFGGTNLLQSFNFPGTTVITEELNDCTTYYWRAGCHPGWHAGSLVGNWQFLYQ